MANCTMGHKGKELSHGTQAEIVICMKVKNFNEEDQKEVFDFFKEYSNSFFTVKIPAIADEVKSDGNNAVNR